jgi:hypothetical protein
MTSTTSNSATERTEVGPYPHELEELVKGCVLEPGWHATLQTRKRDEDFGNGEASGLTLVIVTLTYDTYHPERGRSYAVQHFFPVPITTWNRQSWMRWLFDQYTSVLVHEAMEFFQVPAECDCGATTTADGTRLHEVTCSIGSKVRPYAPNHGPGENPYTVRELTTDLARRTQYTNKVVDH